MVAFALGHPGLGPRRISATLAQERWGRIVVSPNAVWRILRRHGLSRPVAADGEAQPGRRLRSAAGARRSTFIRAGRPSTNGAVERVQRTILEECWRPAFARSLVPRFTGLARDLEAYLGFYNHERAHTGRLTNGRTPAEAIRGGRKTQPRCPGCVATSRGRFTLAQVH